MRISVIITVYNLSSYIAKAIESVLAQTRPADEIIVVDDGSTDASAAQVRLFGDRVRLIQLQQNSGVLVAFQTGIKAATGEILTFLDGDDVWLPAKLAKVEAAFETHPDIIMVTHAHHWIDKDGNLQDKEDVTHRNLKRIMQAGGDIYQQDILLKNSILCYKGVWLGSAFCIRSRFIDIAAYEAWVFSMPGKELAHQDHPLATYIIHSNPGKLIMLIPEILFLYRVFSGNSSGVSINIKTALATLSRSIASVTRTYSLVQQHPEWKEENKAQYYTLLELQFYRDLYTKKWRAAFAKYLKLFLNYWSQKKKFRETQRLLACMIIGPQNFLKIKTWRRFQTFF